MSLRDCVERSGDRSTIDLRRNRRSEIHPEHQKAQTRQETEPGLEAKHSRGNFRARTFSFLPAFWIKVLLKLLFGNFASDSIGGDFNPGGPKNRIEHQFLENVLFPIFF